MKDKTTTLSMCSSENGWLATLETSTRQFTNVYLAHLRLALFPSSPFEFSGILRVGPTKSLTFSPGCNGPRARKFRAEVRVPKKRGGCDVVAGENL